MPPNPRYVKQCLKRYREQGPRGSGYRSAFALVLVIAAATYDLPAAHAAQSSPASPASPAEIGVVRFTEYFEPTTDSRIRRAAHVLTPTEIERVQEALSTRGHLVLATTGILDTRTESALTRFQNAADLPACGCLSYSTVLALGLRPVITQVIIAEPGTEPGSAGDGAAHGVEVLYSAGIERPVHEPAAKVMDSDPDEALETESANESDEPAIRLFFPFLGRPGFVPFFGRPGFVGGVCD